MGVVILIFEHWFYKYALPTLRLKPKGTIWKSRNIMFFSQKLYRFINCVELVSPHHAARELVHSIRQGQIASLFQKSIKRVRMRFIHTLVIYWVLRTDWCLHHNSNFFFLHFHSLRLRVLVLRVLSSALFTVSSRCYECLSWEKKDKTNKTTAYNASLLNHLMENNLAKWQIKKTRRI